MEEEEREKFESYPLCKKILAKECRESSQEFSTEKRGVRHRDIGKLERKTDPACLHFSYFLRVSTKEMQNLDGVFFLYKTRRRMNFFDSKEI